MRVNHMINFFRYKNILEIKALYQFFRFSVVGISHNLSGYIIYLSIAYTGLDPKLIISIFYPIGVLYAYFANKTFTFKNTERHTKILFKYFFIQFLGFIINLSLLFICVDKLSFPHQLVQLFAIVIVAIFLFVGQKYFVFSGCNKDKIIIQ